MMGLDKLSLTLYDLLGYLLPGYVMLLACSLVEASFSSSSLFALATLSGHPISSAIAAYFLGQIVHAIGSTLKNRKYRWFSDGGRYALKSEIQNEVERALREAYALKFDPNKELNKIDTYLLADNYLLASRGSMKRDMLTAREGFFKASTVAFVALAIAMGVTLFSKSPRLQVQQNLFIQTNKFYISIATLVCLLMAILFRARFIFFNRAKNNNALLSFLALYKKEQAQILPSK